MSTVRRRLERIAALDLLERLLAGGLEVEAEESHLRIRPADRLTVDLREEAQRLKPYLLRVLNPPRPTDFCPECGGPFLMRTAFGLWECWTCSERTSEDAYALERIDRENGGTP